MRTPRHTTLYWSAEVAEANKWLDPWFEAGILCPLSGITLSAYCWDGANLQVDTTALTLEVGDVLAVQCEVYDTTFTATLYVNSQATPLAFSSLPFNSKIRVALVLSSNPTS